MDETVQRAVAPPGLFLELGDRELWPAVLDNDIDEIRLLPGELGLLPSGGPVQQSIQPDRFIEIIPGGGQAEERPMVSLFPLHEPEHRIRLDQVEQHLRVPPVRMRQEPDPGGERDDDEEHLPPDNLPDRLAGEDLG